MDKKIILVGNRSREMFIFRKGLIRSLSEEGYHIFIVAPSPDKESTLYFNRFGKYINIDFNKKTKNPFSNLKLCYNLYNIYKAINPDLIIHYTIKPNIWGSIAAGFSRKKSIAVTTGLGYTFLHKNFSTTIIKILYRIALRFSQMVWFLNNDDQQAFVASKIVSANKTLIIPGEGIDTKYFQPCPKTLNDNIIRFLMIARLTGDKGTRELCEAAKIIKNKYKDVEIQLLGELNTDNTGTIDPQYIYGLQEERTIKYLGTSTDVRQEIKNADCLVLPSYREGVPRTLMEGASMGKPLIASDITGCNLVVENNYNGFLCKVRDPKDLASKIEDFINLPPEKKMKMGESGRTLMIHKFEEKIVVHIYKQKIKELLEI